MNGLHVIAGIYLPNSDGAAVGRDCFGSGSRTALYRFEHTIAGEYCAGTEGEKDDDFDGSVVVGNTINNALTSTGAFEVYYEDALVFSKLETGRMPNSMDEIVQGIMRQTKQE